jgi:hypothetical protein
MRSAIKAVPAANSDHVTARAVGPSPEATMMKRMYRLRREQDTPLGSEEETAVLTFEVNDGPFNTKNMGMLSLKPPGTSQDLNPRVDSGGSFVYSQKKRDSSDLADDHAW